MKKILLPLLFSFLWIASAGAYAPPTGTGLSVYQTSPTLITPNLGTPSTLVGTNITGTASAFNIGGTADHLSGALSANQLLGSLTAVAPTGQSVPSCSTSASALQWTTGTGFGCNTALVAASTTGNAATVTTNANLTGPITSVGNATSVAGAAAGMVYAGSTPSFTATPVLGVNASTAGTLGLANGGGSGATVTLQNPSSTAAYNFNFPTTAGAVGAILTSGGGSAAANVWLSDVATGSFLVSGGTSTIPAFTAASSLSPSFVGTNLTGTAASLTAGNVTTNANLTGPITSVGNAVASIAAHGAMMGNGTSAINTIAPSTSGNVLTSNGTDWTSAAAPSGSMGYNAQSTTYAPAASDLGKLVDFTGSSNTTFTLTSCTTLGSGWFSYIRNAGTSNAQLTLASSAGTIDGVATTGYIMYAGEVRQVQCDGTNFHSVVVHGGSAVFTSSTTWQRPPGYSAFLVEIISGGGAGGVRTTTGNASGGSGGAYYPLTVPATNLVAVGSTETVTVGGTAAAVASSNAVGTTGNDSSITLNGSTFTIKGGGGGLDVATSTLAGFTASGYPSVVAVNSNANGFWFSTTEAISTNTTAIIGGMIWASVGGDCTAGNVPAAGGSSLMGGGGGGASSGTAGGTRTGGTSVSGGAGGTGSATGGTGVTAGTAPGGGGGAGVGGSASGAGARGQITVRGIL